MRTLLSEDIQVSSESKRVQTLTRRDPIVLGIVSLVMLLLLACITYGAFRILHTGLQGWLVVLLVISFAVVTMNIVLYLASHVRGYRLALLIGFQAGPAVNLLLSYR